MNEPQLNDEYWMSRALILAKKASDSGEVPVGAVIVYGGNVVGEGWNQPILQQDPTAHAEIQALRHAGKTLANYRMPDTTMYVTIEPCTMCFGAMVHARIGRLVFGALEPKAGVICSNRHLQDSQIYNHQIEWRGGVCEAESTALIQSFFQFRRAQKKALKRP